MLGEFVPREQSAILAARARRQPQHLLEFEPDVVRSSYNLRPFLIHHHLCEHTGFSLDALSALCRRLPRGQVQYRVGAIPGDAHFDSSYARYGEGLHFDDVLEHFEERKAYICIYNPERDAGYRPVLEGLLAEIAAAIEGIDPVITWYSTYVFISTRDAVTPYHMDREMNFLLQVRGAKEVMLWDPHDDEIMSPADKDRLLAAFKSRRPTYSPSFEAKAMHYELRPGLGVHHPFIAPHRVHTGPELPISLALTFRTRKSDMWTSAHAFNNVMRSCGWSPAEVGALHPYADRAKAAAAHAMDVPLALLRKRRHAHSAAENT
ncbi:cupin-like domain-containing protein [Variovorax paradoxus]|nr:cupin-like domain-containing protein [Variovorax paradoxus]